MARDLPSVIIRLTHNFDAWVVGSAADPLNDDPRDYDILVPFHRWHEAVSEIPNGATLNSFKGWKFYDPESDKKIDIWPGDLSWICTRKMFRFAYHPLSGTRIQKIEN